LPEGNTREGNTTVKYRKAFAAIAVIAAVNLSACGGGDDSSGSLAVPSFPAGTTMAKLAAKGEVTVGTKFDQRGFGFKGIGNEPKGFDVEIAKIIAAGLGVEPDDITWVETVSGVREEVIEQGKVDFVVATYTINDERRKRVSFAGPYYVAGQQIMVKSGNTAIKGPESFKLNPSSRVCSVTGSTPAENIKPYLASADQLRLLPKYEDCEAALKNGTDGIVAMTSDNVILLGFVSESDGAYELVGDRFTDEPYGIGIKKGDAAFCEFIGAALKKAREDGSYVKAWNSTVATLAEGTLAPPLPDAFPCA
jgi:glutamate transport system substrate-binding protein